MNKLAKVITGLLCCLLIFVACSENSAIDRLVPPSATKGGLANFNITGVEVQRGKTRNGGVLVSGMVQVPYDIKREQVKPTLLAAIKGLKSQYKDCEWIIAYAIPSEKLQGSGINAGMAEYAEGKIRIDYGVPTASQLAAEAKVAEHDPLRLMSEDEFGLAVDIEAVWQKNHFASIKVGGDGGLSDAKIAAMVARKTNIPAAKIIKLRRQLVMYYGPFWGSEIIS